MSQLIVDRRLEIRWKNRSARGASAGPDSR
jgi:hypothetical protein